MIPSPSHRHRNGGGSEELRELREYYYSTGWDALPGRYEIFPSPGVRVANTASKNKTDIRELL